MTRYERGEGAIGVIDPGAGPGGDTKVRATLSGSALILGALAFLVFWGSDVAWDDKLLGVAAPWWIRLAVHGIAILLITPEVSKNCVIPG